MQIEKKKGNRIHKGEATKSWNPKPYPNPSIRKVLATEKIVPVIIHDIQKAVLEQPITRSPNLCLCIFSLIISWYKMMKTERGTRAMYMEP